MKNVGAVLLDTRGIQKYVFASNKMKTNIGASYLVDTIFLTPVCQVLEDMGVTLPAQDWRKTGKPLMLQDESITAEIAYIGGGNMLLFFRSRSGDALSVCRQFVSRWSEKLLKYTPGLQTGAAVGKFDIEDFQNSLNHMYRMLKENQSNVMPQVDLPYTGISLECDYNNKTADVFNRLVKRNVSAEVDAKLRAARYADARLKELYGSFLEYKGKQLKFADDLNLLGYKEGESYISVIHIDGNNMGVKFSHCRGDGEERKNLSIKVAEAVKTAFVDLITQIKREYLEDKCYDRYLDLKKLTSEEDSVVLPIRPIIIGGDDITIITPGRLGLHYADYFIQRANRQLILSQEQQAHIEACVKRENGRAIKINQYLSCCAGVAIVPDNYPFFRAYTLAEELCANAKKQSRQDDSSWLDFAVLHGDTYPTLEMLRENQYKGVPDENGRTCRMHYGPYRIDAKEERRSLQRLFNLHSKLIEAHKNSVNKIKLMREVLFSDRHSQEIFLENDYSMKKLLKDEKMGNEQETTDGISVGQISASDFWETEAVGDWDVVTTRYIDAIEMDDFMIPGLEGANK